MIEKLLLGGYTKKENQGINELTLDLEKKAFTDYQLLITENTPSYFIVSSDGNSLYTLSNSNDQGGISAYEKVDGEFQLINKVGTLSKVGCHISLDEERQLLFTSNYHLGSIEVFQIKPNKSIEQIDSVLHVGSGPHENQTKAHCHYTSTTPDGNYILNCDLGTDEVYTYELDSINQLNEVSRYLAHPGTGPRHLVFHPSLPIVYLFGELSSTVDVLTFDEANGTLAFVQRVSTIPEDWTEFNSGAAIRVSSDGKYLYVSNRGHNSIAVYAIGDDGLELTQIQSISTYGDIPRDFNFNQTEAFLIVAHQESGTLTLFERNPETGLLELVQKDFAAPEIVCVVQTPK